MILRKEDKPIIMEYLAELIRAQINGTVPAPVPDEVSVEQLIEIACKHQMVYPILGAVIKLPLLEEQLSDIRLLMHQSMIKTLQQVYEVKELQNAFEQAGVKHQMLKGSIMKSIYTNPQMREMGDIDCMIYDETLEKAEYVATQLGYQKKKDIAHHAVFVKDSSLVLEMHWDLYEKTVDKEQYDYYKQWKHARLVQGKEYEYEFSKEDFYVYLISHMAKHFYEEGCGIRNLLDIYVYQKKYETEMDYVYIAEELKKCGLTDFEKHARKLSFLWMEQKESNSFYNNMFLYMLDCGVYGDTKNGIWGQLAKQESDKNNAKLSFLFPTYEYMKEDYKWLEHKGYLLPVAWIIRGVKGMTNKEARKRFNVLDDRQVVNQYKEIYRELHLDFHK